VILNPKKYEKQFSPISNCSAPIWALEPVMQKAAEGLTGHPNVNWFILPRKAFMFFPSSGTTSMFKTERSFCMSKLDAMEPVAIRLASFATNVSQGASSVPSRLPTSKELYTAARSENARQLDFIPEKEVLALKILCLASDAEGLFFFVNSQSRQQQQQQPSNQGEGATTTNSSPNGFKVHFDKEASIGTSIDKVSIYQSSTFWNVSDSERELFSRLATIEALNAIEEIDKQTKTLYPTWLTTLFRLGSSAGACAIWFKGSWQGKAVHSFVSIFTSFLAFWSLSPTFFVFSSYLRYADRRISGGRRRLHSVVEYIVQAGTNRL
jgi:hypothetical protein